MAEESDGKSVTMEEIAQRLMPVFQRVEQHISDLHGKHTAMESMVNQHHDTLTGLVDGIQNAVHGHQKNAIKEHAMANHAGDLDPLVGVYSDMHDGRNLHDDLADAMHSSGLHEPDKMAEAMPHIVAAIKSKYGKYQIAPQETASETAETPVETKEEVPVKEEVTEVATKPSDMENLMSTFDTALGKKK